MIFGWLSGLLGQSGGPGGRRRMAPQALRELSDEIKAHTLAVDRIEVREIVRDPDTGESEPTVVAWVKTRRRPEVAAWLAGAELNVAPPEVRTDWIFLPRTPEAVVIGSVRAGPAWPDFRFNLRFPADRFRRHLRSITTSGVIALTPGPFPSDPGQQGASRFVLVPVEIQPLLHFLRELPPPPVI